MTKDRGTDIERNDAFPADSLEVTAEDPTTEATAGGWGQPPVGPTPPVGDRPFDKTKDRREWTRIFVTSALTILLFLVVLTPLVGLMAKWLTADDVKVYYSLILAPVFSVYSSIMTFYFVTSEDQKRP